MIFFSDKDPAEVIVLSVDWSQVLESGETVSSASWLVSNTSNQTEDTASMISGSVDISASPIIRQKIAGGTDGNSYLHRCRIVTNTGRTLVQGVLQSVKLGA